MATTKPLEAFAAYPFIMHGKEAFEARQQRVKVRDRAYSNKNPGFWCRLYQQVELRPKKPGF